MKAARNIQARRVLAYGLLLAIGTAALQWLDYLYLVRSHPSAIYVVTIAAGFLLVGLAVGRRLFAAPVPTASDGNPEAQAALGISARELTVLRELAAGRSNKEVARALGVSPNTVKTHVARLFEKLGASRRTDAINKARELGLLP